MRQAIFLFIKILKLGPQTLLIRVEALFVIYFKREKEECKISRAFLRKENLGHFDISAGPNSELVLMKDLVSEKLFLTIF